MNWKKMNYINKSFHRFLLEKLLFKYRHVIQGNILDVGSKDRRYDHLFKGKVTAIDTAPDPEKKVEYGNIEERLEFTDNFFDSVVCLEVFQYLCKYEDAIKEIYRLVKSNGQLIITTPLMYNDHADSLRFTKQFITKKFSAYFQIVACINIGNTYTVLYDIVRRKIINIHWSVVRHALIVFIFPWFLALKLLYPLSKEDDCYSGLFIILQKKL